ncbi:hypothetical protein DPSP01_003474 [Paraphaeosphaeria sporulosa]
MHPVLPLHQPLNHRIKRLRSQPRKINIINTTQMSLPAHLHPNTRIILGNSIHNIPRVRRHQPQLPHSEFGQRFVQRKSTRRRPHPGVLLYCRATRLVDIEAEPACAGAAPADDVDSSVGDELGCVEDLGCVELGEGGGGETDCCDSEAGEVDRGWGWGRGFALSGARGRCWRTGRGY